MPAKTYAVGIWFEDCHTVRIQKKAGKLALESHDFPKSFKVSETDDGIQILGSEDGMEINLHISNYEVTGRHFYFSFRDQEDKPYQEFHYTLSAWRKADAVVEFPYNGQQIN